MCDKMDSDDSSSDSFLDCIGQCFAVCCVICETFADDTPANQGCNCCTGGCSDVAEPQRVRTEQPRRNNEAKDAESLSEIVCLNNHRNWDGTSGGEMPVTEQPRPSEEFKDSGAPS